MKIDYSAFYEQLRFTALETWRKSLPAVVEQAISPERHGKITELQAILDQLPRLSSRNVDLMNSVRIEGDDSAELESVLRQLHPWRKGPFHLHGIDIDTEWRSDWKWDRIKDHLNPLAGKRVLDVGCGNGYHLWRMLGAGAKQAIGIDPMIQFVAQFFAVKHYLPEQNGWVLPLGIEQLPPATAAFDTVFSMGVLYHRRSPLDHILFLKDYLRPGGQLVLETLVTEGPLGYSLMPEDRYAKMRNVFFIPSILTLEHWMKRCGLKQVQTVDVCNTTVEEQSTTKWMTFDSLSTFLDPTDSTKTIEGYPAPKRAFIIAHMP